MLRTLEHTRLSVLVVIAAVVVFAWSLRDVKKVLQGHRASTQQVTRSVPSLVYPAMNVPNCSQHRSVHHEVVCLRPNHRDGLG